MTVEIVRAEENGQWMGEGGRKKKAGSVEINGSINGVGEGH